MATRKELLEQKYTQETRAEALFSTNLNGDPEFRFELTEKHWELSDGNRIGEGALWISSRPLLT